MANKRTYINADEELIIQGRLIIEGNIEQRQYTNTVTYSETKFEGETFIINSDGFDKDDVATDATLKLKSGATEGILTYRSADSKLVINRTVVAPTVEADLTGTATAADSLSSAVSIQLAGDVTSSAMTFQNAGDAVTINTSFSNTAVTPNNYGSALLSPTYTVDAQGRLTAAADVAIAIPASQITDFTTAGRALISHVDTGGDGSLTYSNGVITYTGPSASEVRAHLSPGTGLTYSAGEFSITNTSVTATSYGSATAIPTFTVNARGQLSTAADVNIDIPASQVTNFETAAEALFTIGTNSGDGDLSYANGVFDYTGPTASEVQAHISVSDTGGDGSLTYSAGVITYTGPSAADTRAHFTGGTGIDISSGTVAIDSTVVTKANTQTLNGDKTFTGTVDLSSATVPGFSVTGDLNVTGEFNSLTQVDLLVEDASITLRSGAAGNADAFMYVTATGANPYLKWDTGSAKWQFSNDGTTDNDLLTTSQAKALISHVDTGGDGSLTYSAGVITYTGPSASDIRGHLSSGTGISYNQVSGAISTNDSAIVHDSLSGFVADEHVDHSAVSILAGTGLSGGGDITESRTLNVSTGAVTNGATTIPTGNDVYDFVIAQGYSTTAGDITGVTAGAGLSGGGGSGAVTLNVIEATSLAFGGVKIGYTENGKNYPVEISSGKAFVNVPWVDNNDNTTYTAGNGLDLAGTSFSVDLTDTTTFTSTNTSNRAVVRDGSGNFSAGTITATATQAKYADLAEMYTADADYEPGTVVIVGGTAEVTVTDQPGSYTVAGIVSTDPAYLMNAETEGVAVALRGRVPCKVLGNVNKGDILVTSNLPGHAMVGAMPHTLSSLQIIGIALETKTDAQPGVIEVLV